MTSPPDPAALVRVVLDSNSADPLVDVEGAYDQLRNAVDHGLVDVLFTHVVIEELASTPDIERRILLLLAVIGVGRLVPTGVFVIGQSRLDHARLSDSTFGYEGFSTGTDRHAKDGLIAVTTRFEGATLITNDVRLAARANDRGIRVQSMAEFLAELNPTTSP